MNDVDYGLIAVCGLFFLAALIWLIRCARISQVAREIEEQDRGRYQ